MIACGLLGSCNWGLTPRHLKISDAEVTVLLDASKEFPRESFGFSPMPTDPSVEVVLSSPGFGQDYDLVMEVEKPVKKKIIFSRNAGGNGYRWVHESETFTGPSSQGNPSADPPPRIRLVYETKKILTDSPNELLITYTGPDARFPSSGNLSLGSAKRIIEMWKNAPPASESPGSARSAASSALEKW